MRSPMRGKGMPYARYSCSNQPAPSPRSSRPSLITSRVAAILASTAGERYEWQSTLVPSRTRRVSRARADSVVQHSSRGIERGSSARAPAPTAIPASST